MLKKVYTFIILYHIIIYYISLIFICIYLYKYRYLYKVFSYYFITLFNITIIQFWFVQNNFFI